MFIETEDTPNPASLKFIPGGRDVMGTGTADFTTAQGTGRSPLAAALFSVDGVTRVFLGADFVTITKAESEEWSQIRPLVMSVLVDHFVSGRPVIDGASGFPDEDVSDEDVSGEDSEIIAQIKELLDTRVRPAVAGDGGDIVFRGYRDGVVRLHMQGSCSGCPSSSATLKHGVENMLRHYVPEVQSVEQVEA